MLLTLAALSAVGLVSAAYAHHHHVSTKLDAAAADLAEVKREVAQVEIEADLRDCLKELPMLQRRWVEPLRKAA